MSEPEKFLARWSRRKLEPEADTPEPPQTATDTSPSPPDTSERSPDSAPAAPATADFDLSSLPSLESITAATDLSGFLRPGVPLALQRAALRRAWALDPPSRDMLLMAEYAGDFTDAGAMAGFGPLQMTDELRQLAQRIVGGGRPAAAGPESAELAGSEPRSAQASDEEATNRLQAGDGSIADAVGSIPAPAEDQTASSEDEMQQSAALSQDVDQDVASQYESKPETVSNATIRRGHGGALPQ